METTLAGKAFSYNSKKLSKVFTSNTELLLKIQNF